MKVHKRKDGKYSFIGMTEEEVSVISSLLGLTSFTLSGAERRLYNEVADLPQISYVSADSNEDIVLFRKR